MSYSRKDRDVVAAMVTALRAAGEEVWVVAFVEYPSKFASIKLRTVSVTENPAT
jgi:hypothetical protein